MAHRTAPEPAQTETTATPPDLATMRAAVRQLLGESAPPGPEFLETLVLQIRGHIQLLIPEVQHVADRLPKNDIPRYCALACLGEARRKLSLPAGGSLSRDLAHARRLARVLNALCDHHENLAAPSAT
ncbi:DUF6415 family natural product biosynthesis protein [Streptomyces sp. NPDC047990]|uniref:DUF6415 family natural product biosynthesis protein n=1 Tax=Streptomyces sp. NPDC047990 TaxID=3365496 RepID=UPI0037134F7D